MKNDSTHQASAEAPSPGVGSSDLFGSSWPPKDLGKGPNPYTYGTWQWHEHECAECYRWDRITMRFKIAGIVLFFFAALAYGAWAFGLIP